MCLNFNDPKLKNSTEWYCFERVYRTDPSGNEVGHVQSNLSKWEMDKRENSIQSICQAPPFCPFYSETRIIEKPL